MTLISIISKLMLISLISILLTTVSLGCTAQSLPYYIKPDTIVYENEFNIVYGPTYKLGEEELKNEFFTTLGNSYYELEYFDYGTNGDLTSIEIVLVVDEQGEASISYIAAVADEIDQFKAPLERVLDRIKYLWKPAFTISKENGTKGPVTWNVNVNLLFKDGFLNSVKISY